MPDLSIVIVSYQVREHLIRCLASLASLQGALASEVFVVDNASTDGSVEWMRTNAPWVKLIANAENRGFAAANNQAFAQASGRYVLLLNPDTLVPAVEPNGLETLVGFMDAQPRAGACGAKLCYPDGSLQHSAFRFPSLAQIYFDLFPTNWRLHESRWNGRYPRRWYDAGQPFRIDHPLGAAMLVRRRAAEQIGWLDENFFIYAEEIDWCLRLRNAGWEIWCVPRAEIIHYEAQSTRQFREAMFIQLWRARLHLFHKHYSRAFNAAAARLIQLGMQRARAELRRGTVSGMEVERRAQAYEAVMRLAARDPAQW